MGEKSDSKKASSPYVVLENRPIDHWKVTELKEELKKRKLGTGGLKAELVKRLDEAVRYEMDEAKKNLENDLNSEVLPPVEEKTADVIDDTIDKNEGLQKDNMVQDLNNDNKDVQLEMNMDQGHYDLQPLDEKTVTEGEGGIASTRVESIKIVEEISVKTTIVSSEEMVSEQISGQESEMIENKNKDKLLDQQQGNDVSKPESKSPEEEQQTKPSSSDLFSGNQVDEVSKVTSDSISIDTISNTEKNELKDNIIADDVKLELDNKPDEMVQPPLTNTDLDDIKSESVEDNKQHKDKAPAKEKEANNDENNDNVKSESVEAVEPLKNKVIDEEKYVKNDSGDVDVGSSEKLNLDRSSGDDSMEEDIMESKQIDSKFRSEEVGDRSEKIEVPLVKEDVMVEDVTDDKNFAPVDDKTGPNVISTKRKPHDEEAPQNSEVVKRQRRWNSEGLKVVPEQQQSANHSASTTPKDAFQIPAKRAFSRSESTLSQESPKERVVPPSSKPPTTSLRIDNFLRPFTLKAVQELLGKTGTVVSFWMDQIKTHCYVTYESVEEATETRNALCNLQWPVNGGRLLMADFVDPQEVKNRVNPPPPSPAAPATTLPPSTTQPSQPSPRLPIQKQALPPPPSLPPPPPLSNPPSARERALLPPPPPEKVDPPIVTLDDLFRKTRATPRIYYLPLSDKEVAAKLNAQGKPVKQ